MNTRARLASAVVGGSLLFTAVGAVAATQIESPDEAAARAEPPDPSRIAVPAEERLLRAEVVARGDIYVAESVPIQLPATEGLVLTEAPPLVGAAVNEGERLLEVSERPVFLFSGALPMYRDLVPGSVGDDVAQLERALVRLGYAAAADETFDRATSEALQRLYSDRGYAVPAPSADSLAAITSARDAVASQEAAIRAAGGGGAAVLRAESALDLALQDVAIAEAAAEQTTLAAAAGVEQARAEESSARAELATAQERLTEARGGQHPDTGLPPTRSEIVALEGAVTSAERAVTSATSSVAVAQSGQRQTELQNQRDLAAAFDAVEIARAELNELRAADTDQSVDQLDAARRALATLEAASGAGAPRSEIMFVPTTPATVVSLTAQLGDLLTGPIGEIGQAALAVRFAIGPADRERLRNGDTARLTGDGLPVALDADIVSIATEPGGAAGPGRYGVEARVVTSVVGDATRYSGLNVRVAVGVETSQGAVLAVPVAALYSTSDGRARVQVQESANERPRTVIVKPGLVADGYVEVEPVDGSLSAGDLVILGDSPGED